MTNMNVSKNFYRSVLMFILVNLGIFNRC